jgi:hypothetical protein
LADLQGSLFNISFILHSNFATTIQPMNKNILFLAFILMMQGALCFAQTPVKKPLTHDVYNAWKKLDKQQISDNGKYVSYEISPLKGDGWLHWHNLVSGSHDSLFRGQSRVT